MAFPIRKGNLHVIQRFLEEVITKRNEHLLQKYGSISKHLEYATQLENLNWLLTNRVLSKSVYDEKAAQLNTLFPQQAEKSPIGFSSR